MIKSGAIVAARKVTSNNDIMVLNGTNLLLCFILDCLLDFAINISDQRIASRDEGGTLVPILQGPAKKS